MRCVLLVLVLLLIGCVAALAGPGWRDLPEDAARQWIMEHAQQMAKEFCEEYPGDEACRRAGREERGGRHSVRESRAVDFCSRYHLHREDYVRNGWSYWRCVR